MADISVDPKFTVSLGAAYTTEPVNVNLAVQDLRPGQYRRQLAKQRPAGRRAARRRHCDPAGQPRDYLCAAVRSGDHLRRWIHADCLRAELCGGAMAG